MKFPIVTLLATLVAFSPVFAEPDEATSANAEPTDAALALDASTLSAAFDDSGVASYRCRLALKDFEKAIADANASAVAQRAKVSEITKTFLKTAMDKARADGDLERVLVFQKALETVDGEIAGDAEEIVKLRDGRTAQLDKIDKGLVASGLTAANAFHAALEWQKKEITQKGEIETALKVAAFQKQVEEWAKSMRTHAAFGHPSPATVQADVRRPAAPPAGRGDDISPRETALPRTRLASTRTSAMRSRLLMGGGGNAKTEAAVMRSLRWLKAVQNHDGSWPNNKVAMTGYALLTFLAHGEVPGSSPEFGETVQRAIDFLISEQAKTGSGLFTKSGAGYAHAIAAYAMCEAYGMTLDPEIKKAADAGLAVIIAGQHPSGGWDYNWKQSNRDDTSLMGWAAQALKAGITADFYHDPKALETASALCVRGFKKNGFKDGGFGYTGPAKGGLTGVGTLCLQFHHAGGDNYVKNSLKNIIYRWNPEWIGYSPERAAKGEKMEKPKEVPPGAIDGACPQYYYYYGTQAVFQGGEQWRKWNDRMWPSYVAAQFKIEKGEAGSTCVCGQRLCSKLKEPYTDDKGQLQEIGHWVNTDAHTDRPIMDTCLAALQLMTYYRYPKETAR